ncbi:hypothetical protein MRB53_030412 [Persea americana]|uniref:Uncharacterized protein n=1 Tax=Persea americana TaxID=3435 RepID=A0ACC2KLT0_PERAE|nr:hypothetical protein MRB53_030412 [Persea americana]|eukprot:TRINITY_DN7593_c0_g2_i2.p1 TRINITY_DN7593_c0_g2~~TRINITY_DN7593_c0_g2_i2.p1  ORF type:complete len:393 (-),score=72.09 TRINITY_DN7593_c0_g2_i2:353-1531(-)
MRNPLLLKRLSSRFLSSSSHLPCHSIFPCLFSAAPFIRLSPLFLPSDFQLRKKQDRAEISTSASSFDRPNDNKSDPTSSFLPYVSVRIKCRSKEIADMLSEALFCFGACSASIDEVDNCQSIGDILITSVFSDNEDVHTSISRAADSIGLQEIPSIEVIMCEQYDWIKNTKELFQPVEVTDGLWVVPEWRTPPDVKATNIILNPGLAFGTGEHPTTKLCLLLLHGLIKGGENILDYGTGSGILGIAALKLGAAFAVGTDIDPQAITSARQNAALNNIQSSKLHLYLVPGKVTPNSSSGKRNGGTEERSLNSMEIADGMEKFDIIIANILLNNLIELADLIVSYAKPGAVIGVSGILSEQIPEIEKCYSQHLDNIEVREMDGWACVSGTKRKS